MCLGLSYNYLTMEPTTWRVLLIDDDEDDYYLTREFLNQARGRKIRLDWASSYEAGWGKLNSCPYHAVLVDYDLGSHSGLDLVREATTRQVKAPMIMLSGRGSYEVDVEAMRLGAVDYLSKEEVTAPLLERAIRQGVGVDGRALVAMPSEMFYHLDDADLGRIVGYIRSIEDSAETALWLVENGGCAGIFHAINEDDVQRVIRHGAAITGYERTRRDPRHLPSGSCPRRGSPCTLRAPWTLAPHARDAGELSVDACQRLTTATSSTRSSR